MIAIPGSLHEVAHRGSFDRAGSGACVHMSRARNPPNGSRASNRSGPGVEHLLLAGANRDREDVAASGFGLTPAVRLCYHSMPESANHQRGTYAAPSSIGLRVPVPGGQVSRAPREARIDREA
jgi:hypothetical protein